MGRLNETCSLVMPILSDILQAIISASAQALYGITAKLGKIVGSLRFADTIKDAVHTINSSVGFAFQRKINPFRPYSSFYKTPCTDLIDVVYGEEKKLSQWDRRDLPDICRHHHNHVIMAPYLNSRHYLMLLSDTYWNRGEIACTINQ